MALNCHLLPTNANLPSFRNQSIHQYLHGLMLNSDATPYTC